MKPDLAEFLNSLDWTAPAVSLLDEMEAWLLTYRRRLSYEDVCDMADRLVMSRLK